MSKSTELQELQARFQLAMTVTGTGIWDWDLRTNEVFFSDKWKTMIGYETDEIGDAYMEWESRVHPDDLPKCLEAIENYLRGDDDEYHLEHRLRHKNGTYIWISSRGAALHDEGGSPYRFIGSHIDISDRKRTELELNRQHKALQQLLAIHDKERKLVSYEIHDGLAQELAALVMYLESAGKVCSGTTGRVEGCLNACKGADDCNIIQSSIGIARKAFIEVRRLVSDLRPPVLDDGGIVPAIVTLLEGSELTVYLEAGTVDGERYEPMLENAIFRIVQESLQNVKRHSGQDKAEIEIKQIGKIIMVRVKDRGCGFDTTIIEDGRFGILGIIERAHSFGGQISLTSTTSGTEVLATLPAIRCPDGISRDPFRGS